MNNQHFDDFFTDGIFFEDSKIEPEYTEEDTIIEIKSQLNLCMSCTSFKGFMGESGICSINKICICKNPKALIDMWDIKCDKWVISEKYSNLIKTFEDGRKES